MEAMENLPNHIIEHEALKVKGVPVLDTRYVNVTGDTMTGDLTIEASLIVNAHNGIYFGSTRGSNIYFDSFGLNLYSVNAAGADDRIALWNGSGATMLMANPSANHTNYFPATTGEVAILPQNYVIATVSVNDGGTGYAVGNVLILEGGNADGRVTVSTVNDGVITGVSLTTPGTGYQVQNVNTLGGSGSGAIISIDSIVAEDPRTMAMLEVENVFTAINRFGDGTNYTEIKTDGEINLHGTARVIRDLWIDAAGIKAPGAKPATEVSFGALETSAWEFSNEAVEANQESVSWRIAVLYDFDRTEEVIIRLGWTSGSTGNCKWQLKYRWFSEDEDMTQDGEETLTVTDSASATANGLVVTTIEGINAPDATDATIIFKLTRLSADENDTIGDTVELHGVCFNYISNKLGEAL